MFTTYEKTQPTDYPTRPSDEEIDSLTEQAYDEDLDFKDDEYFYGWDMRSKVAARLSSIAESYRRDTFEFMQKST